MQSILSTMKYWQLWYWYYYAHSGKDARGISPG